MQARYPALVAASNNAWKTSAQAISLSPSSSDSESSDDHHPSTSAKPTAKANPEASPTTPTSPSTYYDARSRPMSMAVDDTNGQSDGKGDKKQGKKRKVFNISSSKSASSAYPNQSGSSTSPGPTTDPKLSIKKMRAFLFTRTVPRPEVRGLFPSSMKMSLSRSKSSAKSGLSSEQEKGKGKEKYEESGDANADGDAADGARQEKLNRIASLMNLRTTSATELGAEVGVAVISEKEEMDNEKLQPIDPDLLAPPLSRTRSHPPRSPSPASVRSRNSRSLLNVETDKGDAVEGEARTTDAAGEDSDAIGNTDVNSGAGQLIDEQTAAKSRSGFAILRMAETLVREGVKRICGPCFGYSD